MKPSILTISFLIFIIGFLFIMMNNPDVFRINQNENQTDKCFMMFFFTCMSSIITYYLVSLFYE
jgi:hypothetical protein